jgi:predicted amidohydrolase
MAQDFQTALDSFLQGAVRIANEDANHPVTFETQVGPRYIRVVRCDRGQRSAHCFIDKSNGDVLKTGGWAGPVKTKQARGNIFDHSNGLANVVAHGLRYLTRGPV